MLLKTSYKMKPPPSVKPRRDILSQLDCVGLWLMNERSGTKVFDLSKSRLTGTFVNDVFWTTGKYGPALDFPGTSDYVTTPAAPDLSSGAVTVVARIRSRNMGNYRVLTSMKKTLFGLDANGKLVWWPDIDLASVTSTDALAVNVDYYVAVTQDSANNYTFYIDGKNAGSGSTSAIDNAAGGNHIGRYGPADTWSYNGIIDYVMMCDRALRFSEITKFCRPSFRMFEKKTNSALLTHITPAVVARRRSHIGFRPITGADRLRGLRSSSLY